MRLIRSKVFRAFPELDRFSDEQCRRFVAAANSSWRRRLLRWFIVGLAGCFGVMIAMAIIAFAITTLDRISRLRMLGDVPILLLGILIASAALAIGLIPTLILRDSLLRRTVRRLIQRCGACPKCHYSLLGMRIAPDCSITCPECGLKIDVDESMGELATDAEGEPVYKPEIARDHEITKQRRRKRHRRFFQAVAATITLILLAAGGWWLLLINQAHRAIRDRTGTADIRKVQQSMWSSGPTATSIDDGIAEFSRYLTLVKGCSDAASFRLYPLQTPANANYFFEASTLSPSTIPAAFDKQNGEGAYAACREFTLATLQRARENGVTEGLKQLLAFHGPIRPMAPETDQSFVSVLIPDLGYTRQTARFNGARMILALQSGDRAEYMEALEEILALAHVAERQGLLIDRLVAIAIDSLAFRRLNEDKTHFPDAAWFEDALAILKRRALHSPLSQTMEIERIAGLDSVQWYFSSPKRIAKATFGIPDPDFFGYSSTGAAPFGAIGTYERNKSAWNDMFFSFIAAADKPVSQRPPSAFGKTGLIIIDQMLPSIATAFRSSDNSAYEQRFSTLALASDLFRLRNGRPPKSPEELTALLPDPAFLIDPLSERPFRFVVRDDSGKDGALFEIRDGEDDEVKPGQPAKPPPRSPVPAKPSPKK